MVSNVCSRLELPDMSLGGITRGMCLVAAFRRSSNPGGSLRRGGSFGCANGLTHGHVIGAGRNDVGGDVLYCATSRRCRIYEPTVRGCLVCGCVGRYRTTWRFCRIFSIFCVWLRRDRWALQNILYIFSAAGVAVEVLRGPCTSVWSRRKFRRQTCAAHQGTRLLSTA